MDIIDVSSFLSTMKSCFIQLSSKQKKTIASSSILTNGEARAN